MTPASRDELWRLFASYDWYTDAGLFERAWKEVWEPLGGEGDDQEAVERTEEMMVEFRREVYEREKGEMLARVLDRCYPEEGARLQREALERLQVRDPPPEPTI